MVHENRKGIFAKSKSIGLINLGNLSHDSLPAWQTALSQEHPAILFNWEKDKTIEPNMDWKFCVEPYEDHFPVLCVGKHGSRVWLTLTASYHVVGKLVPPPSSGEAQPAKKENG